MEYSFFYRKKIENISKEYIASHLDYDLFVTAFNDSFRVKYLYDNISSKNKHWIIFPEYQFNEIEIAQINGKKIDYSNSKLTESDIILDYFNNNEKLFRTSSKIAIDITGMLRPYVVFLVRFLKFKKISKVDFIYSEPEHYMKKEDTLFSIEHLNIRSIDGCEGTHNPETNKDLLLIGSGYDHKRISRIAREKKQSRKVQILGFPSLQADMFQQNILKSYKAETDVLSGEFNLNSKELILAPANDPFITAQAISDYIKKEERIEPFTNIYLCPLSTKAQTLGIALYYTFEAYNKPASIIFPFSKRYAKETSKGISKICIYTVEFPL
jgi:hypothetical protein